MACWGESVDIFGGIDLGADDAQVPNECRALARPNSTWRHVSPRSRSVLSGMFAKGCPPPPSRPPSPLDVSNDGTYELSWRIIGVSPLTAGPARIFLGTVAFLSTPSGRSLPGDAAASYRRHVKWSSRPPLFLLNKEGPCLVDVVTLPSTSSFFCVVNYLAQWRFCCLALRLRRSAQHWLGSNPSRRSMRGSRSNLPVLGLPNASGQKRHRACEGFHDVARGNAVGLPVQSLGEKQTSSLSRCLGPRSALSSSAPCGNSYGEHLDAVRLPHAPYATIGPDGCSGVGPTHALSHHSSRGTSALARHPDATAESLHLRYAGNETNSMAPNHNRSTSTFLRRTGATALTGIDAVGMAAAIGHVLGTREFGLRWSTTDTASRVRRFRILRPHLGCAGALVAGNGRRRGNLAASWSTGPYLMLRYLTSCLTENLGI